MYKYMIVLLVVLNFSNYRLDAIMQSVHSAKKNNELSLSKPNACLSKAPRISNAPAVVGPLLCDNSDLKKLLQQLLKQCNCNSTGTGVVSGCACPPTPITAPITITLPGFYCLANDITGSISIEADDVVIDLNNHTITGDIFIHFGAHRIIYNGKITGALGAGITSDPNIFDTQLNNLSITNCSTGMNLATVTDCLINNVTIESCGIGMVFAGINSNLTIENFSIFDSQEKALDTTLSSCETIFLTNGIIDTAVNFGIQFGDVTNIHMTNVAVNNITAFPSTGILFDGFTDACFLRNVTTNNTHTVGIDFAFLHNGILQDCHVFDCTSSNGTRGFSIAGGTFIQFINCSANQITGAIENLNGPNPSMGFFIADGLGAQFSGCSANQIVSSNDNAYGFLMQSSRDVCFKDCTVQLLFAGLPETSAGFSIIDTTSLRFDACQVLDIEFGAGYIVDSTSFNSVFDNCLINGSRLEGFLIEGGQNSLTNCQALSCLDGFSLTGTGNILNYCQSNFNVNNGFISTGTQNILGNCSAIQNGTNGYFGVQLYHCFATQNGTDYNTVNGPLNNVTDTIFQAGANLFF